MLKKLILCSALIFILIISGCAVSAVEREEFENGIYTGEWQRGRPHGHGTLIAETDEAVTSYVGEWRSGRRRGQGLHVRTGSDGSVLTFEGGWRNNQRNGQGRHIFEHADGSTITHEGNFINDAIHGQATMTITIVAYGEIVQTVEFEGEFTHGVMHGYGREMTKDRYGNIISSRFGRWEWDEFVG